MNQITKTSRPRIIKGQVVASTNSTTSLLLIVCKQLNKQVIEYYRPFTTDVRRKLVILNV